MPSIDTIQSLQPTVVLDDVFKLHVRRSLRTKHHKSKDKHHKEKRKKRKHSKSADDLELKVNQHDSGSLQNEQKTPEEPEDTKVCSSVPDCRTNLVVQESKVKASVKKCTAKTEVLDKVECVKDVHSENDLPSNRVEDTSAFEDKKNKNYNFELNEQEQDNATQNQDLENLALETISENIENDSLDETLNYPLEPKSQNNEERNILQYGGVEESAETVSSVAKDDSKDPDDRKLKKKKRRTKHENQAEKNTMTQSNEDPGEETMHKHRKRKHKHVQGEHKNKKHHDVRKAPQDGIIVAEEAKELDLIATDFTGIAADMIQNEQVSESATLEPQRLAITIKLCQDCNCRHLQDACPLITPQYVINDSITYEDWLVKYQDNLDVVKAINSQDPMSEGYGKFTDDGFDSDEDSVASEHCKLKAKEESEEKQLQIDQSKPLYSRESLPECLQLKSTNSDHGLGIYAKSPVPIYAQLGPLIGRPVKEMDIPDDFTMRHIWEVIIY